MSQIDGFDKILDEVGISSLSVISFVISALVKMTLPINIIGSEFVNPPPSFRCVQNSQNSSQSYSRDDCYINNSTDGSEKCTEFEYDRSVFKTTLSMEFDLVCDRNYLIPMYQTCFSVGCVIGTAFGGIIADYYGRLWAVKIGVIMALTSSLFICWSPNLIVTMIARLFLGIFDLMMVYPAFLLMIEVVPKQYRAQFGFVESLPMALTLSAMAGVAQLLRKWRELQLTSCFAAILLIPITFMIGKESPRWLLLNDRYDEAYAILAKAAKIKNGDEDDAKRKRLEESLIVTMKKYKSMEEKNKKSIFDSLLKPIKLLTGPLKFLIMKLLIIWLLNSIMYIGIPLNSEAFSSPFIYIALIGASEILAYSIFVPFNSYFGRRVTASTTLIGAGLCTISPLVYDLLIGKNEIFKMAATFVAYWFICIAYQIIYLCTPEILPTTVRSSGASFLHLISYAGFIIPPFFLDMIGTNIPWMPTVIFGSCAFANGLLILTLPETKGKNLPETIADTKDLMRKKKKDSTNL